MSISIEEYIQSIKDDEMKLREFEAASSSAAALAALAKQRGFGYPDALSDDELEVVTGGVGVSAEGTRMTTMQEMDNIIERTSAHYFQDMFRKYKKR